jgi:murein DD-endopeptidase MepM/ murein hydrolase activator NlpD
MANRFYTILVIPEKTSQVRRVVLPAWMLKGAAIAFAFVTLVALVMVLDYWFVMNQIGENKELRMENRRLRQQVQVFKNKIATIESTMERVKTFATRLKVITNIEDRGGLLQSLNQPLPDAGTNIGVARAIPAATTGDPDAPAKTVPDATETTGMASALSLPQLQMENPEDVQLRKEYELLDDRFSELNRDTLFVEQMLQDQYELLADQKAFLAALPTRKPAVGYFTSGFGVRKSPYGDRIKMHEGLDIANRPGTVIKAPADGVVVFADTKSGYGQTVILDHGYGLETWYGHLRKMTVQRGQKIHRGDQIALLGNSGRSTGPHVHYEVRVHGTPVDPLSYILEN